MLQLAYIPFNQIAGDSTNICFILTRNKTVKVKVDPQTASAFGDRVDPRL